MRLSSLDKAFLNHQIIYCLLR